MPKKIDVDDQVINDLSNKLQVVRTETSQVRNGTNPTDPAHPRGFPLNRIDVLAGGPNWPAGADLKAKLLAIGQQLDQHITAMDGRLDHYSQVLLNLLRDSDDTENKNIFLGQFMGQ